MRLKDAYLVAKKLNTLNNGFVTSVKKSSYKNYDVISEPVELATIRNGLDLMYQYHKDFNANVKAKYGK